MFYCSLVLLSDVYKFNELSGLGYIVCLWALSALHNDVQMQVGTHLSYIL